MSESTRVIFLLFCCFVFVTSLFYRRFESVKRFGNYWITHGIWDLLVYRKTASVFENPAPPVQTTVSVVMLKPVVEGGRML